MIFLGRGRFKTEVQSLDNDYPNRKLKRLVKMTDIYISLSVINASMGHSSENIHKFWASLEIR